MPFFSDPSSNSPSKQTTPSSLDLQNAETLHTIVTKIRRKNIGRWSKKKWANELRILRQSLEDGDERITQAIVWLGEHAADTGVPPVSGARSFRRYFDWLEDAMHRDVGRPATDTFSKEEEHEILTLLQDLKRHMYWPQQSEKQLEHIIRISWSNYRWVRQQIRQICYGVVDPSRFDETRRRQDFADYVARKLSPPSIFLSNWFFDVNKIICNWQEWSGDLKGFAFRKDHKLFYQMGRKWGLVYTGRESSFNDMMDELKVKETV